MPTKAKTRKSSAKKGNGKGTAKIYEMVTERIIKALEEGTVPWKRPWAVEGGIHRSLKSKKAYRGINQFLLDLTALSKGLSSPYWLTWKQVEEFGGKVKEDERKEYTIVVFFKPLPIETDEIDKKTGKKKIKTIPLLRYYRVYNVEQTEGIDPKKIPQVTKHEEFTPIERAEKVIKGMPNPPKMHHGGTQASYNVERDVLSMPARKTFESAEAYYATDFHERTHSTRHPSRLNRKKEDNRFGSGPYAKEELVAELGSAMLCALVGIDIDKQQEQTAAYIKSWLERLKDDPKLIVSAGAQAQRACDYILGELKNGEEE